MHLMYHSGKPVKRKEVVGCLERKKGSPGPVSESGPHGRRQHSQEPLGGRRGNIWIGKIVGISHGCSQGFEGESAVRHGVRCDRVSGHGVGINHSRWDFSEH